MHVHVLFHNLGGDISSYGRCPGGVGDQKQSVAFLHEVSFVSQGGVRENMEPSWPTWFLNLTTVLMASEIRVGSMSKVYSKVRTFNVMRSQHVL